MRALLRAVLATVVTMSAVSCATLRLESRGSNAGPRRPNAVRSVGGETASASAPRQEGELGDPRGARVAVPMPDGPLPVTFLGQNLSAEERERLEAAAPNVRILSVSSQGEALRHAAEADGADAGICTPEFLAAASKLRWVQAFSAGVDRYLEVEELVENDAIVMTNMKGMHGPAIADHVMAMLLSVTRNLRFYHGAMERGEWDRRGGSEGMSALAGRTMLVAGMGGIGTEVARRAHGFGMRVVATTRREKARPEFVDELALAPELDRLIRAADVIVICLPLTEETEGLFDAERLALARPEAILVNIGRGRIVDTDALVDALESGALWGACLDVTDPEPLPADHPLWSLPRVIVTPHVAWRASLTRERSAALFAENFRRFGNGEPLLNVVDKRAGY